MLLFYSCLLCVWLWIIITSYHFPSSLLVFNCVLLSCIIIITTYDFQKNCRHLAAVTTAKIARMQALCMHIPFHALCYFPWCVFIYNMIPPFKKYKYKVITQSKDCTMKVTRKREKENGTHNQIQGYDASCNKIQNTKWASAQKVYKGGKGIL